MTRWIFEFKAKGSPGQPELHSKTLSQKINNLVSHVSTAGGRPITQHLGGEGKERPEFKATISYLACLKPA